MVFQIQPAFTQIEFNPTTSITTKKPADVFSIAGNHEKAEERSVLLHQD
jgi:hypothetical protein